MRFSEYSLSAVAVFLGAFLLFAVQPLEGKMLLPLFGGASAVWATALLFFTSMLFLGYAYVYFLTHLAKNWQVIVHLGLLCIAFLFVLISSSTLSPALSVISPALQVLALLFTSIGLPFFLLATTSPLLQYWYGTSGKEPYSLYALSNVASLAALLGYPFLLEPRVTLSHQKALWTTLFLAYVLCMTARALSWWFGESKRLSARANEISLSKSITWVLLAALPSFTLVATTTEITQAIAPIPLLWVVPLTLYLFTFVLAFAGRGQSIYTPLRFFFVALVAYWFTPAVHSDIVIQIVAYFALLFFCGLSCHVLLYRSRPPAESSPYFYVLLSLGGAVGALLGSVIAPLVFSDYLEFPLALAASGALSIWLLPSAFFPRILDAKRVFATRAIFIGIIATLFLRMVFPTQDTLLVSSRNFYGVVKVLFYGDVISLMHGTTLHGMQFTKAEDARLPTAYYTPGSGIGRSILYEESIRGGKHLRIGVIGLGTGTIAAYCRKGDMYTFYEIDPRIERIARSYFSYLAHCKGADVRIGDGRIVLAGEEKKGELGAYDVLAADAFSNDTIPVHLLTREAIELYSQHLRSEKSIIAIHVSNRYLNLAPVVFRLAAELRFNAILVSDSGESSPGGSPSAWVLLSKDPKAFTSAAFANANAALPEVAKDVWTDEYSSLLPFLDLPRPWE